MTTLAAEDKVIHATAMRNLAQPLLLVLCACASPTGELESPSTDENAPCSLDIPPLLDFGDVAVGDTAERSLTVANISDRPCKITAPIVEGAGFDLGNVWDPQVAGRASLPLPITFAPEREGVHRGWLTFDDGMMTALKGLGARRRNLVVDEFEVPLPIAVDLLLVIDDSSSMADEQPTITENLEGLVAHLLAREVDFRIGITTTDMSDSGTAGRLLPLGATGPKIVSPSTPDPVQEAVDLAMVGTMGSTNTQGLVAAVAALVEGEAEGLVRSNALLLVLVVSDGDDLSDEPVDSLVRRLFSVKGARNTNLFSVSAVVGGANGCSGPGGTASPGSRYIEAARLTGGVFESICAADWWRALVSTSVELPVFISEKLYLTNQPNPETIVVSVDGVSVDSVNEHGAAVWSYDMALNAIVFTPIAYPAPGSFIRVEYEPELL